MEETGKRISINFERLEWYAYILKRAIANREPKTAWDACASIMSHFENAYGPASQERIDERAVDSFERSY